MLKRHEVEVLVKAGHGKTEVARISGVSLRAVKRIAQEEPVVHVDDKARTKPTTDREAQHGPEFPETGGRDSRGDARLALARDPAPGARGGV